MNHYRVLPTGSTPTKKSICTEPLSTFECLRDFSANLLPVLWLVLHTVAFSPDVVSIPSVISYLKAFKLKTAGA